MTWYVFAIRLMIALFLGALVGAERQWRQRTAGLRIVSAPGAGDENGAEHVLVEST